MGRSGLCGLGARTWLLVVMEWSAALSRWCIGMLLELGRSCDVTLHALCTECAQVASGIGYIFASTHTPTNLYAYYSAKHTKALT